MSGPLSRGVGTRAFVLSPRRRSWLWLACAVALVLTYLALWTLYSTTHLSSFGRYEQLTPAASTRQFDADFRLLSLVRTETLEGGDRDPQHASADAVWVVATLEVVRRSKDPNFLCLTELLGPDHRAWERTTLLDVTRRLPMFCDNDEVAVGEPFRFEAIFEIPARDAETLYGVVLVNPVDSTPEQVLTPPR